MEIQGRFLVLESVNARTKRDHWVPGLPRHRWCTVRSHFPPNRTQGSNQQLLLLVNSSGLISNKFSQQTAAGVHITVNNHNTLPFVPALSQGIELVLHAHRAHSLLESVTARAKRDHWVPGLPGHRWYTVRSHLVGWAWRSYEHRYGR